MDTIIIQQIQRNDAAVIGKLFDAYGSSLYGVVLRIVQQEDLAQQVVQDAFVKIWKHGHTYDESKGRLFTWMLNIARNTAIDVLRSSSRKQSQSTVEMDKMAFQLEADQKDPHLMDVQEIVGRLDEKYRVIVQKIYFEGYSHAELSEEMDIPLGTVKTRLRYALSELKGLMGVSTIQVIAILTSFTKTI